MDQMGFNQKEATVLRVESRKQLPGIKHVAIRYHFIRDQIEAKEIIRMN